MITLIKELMMRQLVTVNPNDTADKVLSIFSKEKIHHIPVIDAKGELHGILSNVDMERIKHGASLFNNPDKESLNASLFRTLLVKDIMTSKVISLKPNDTLHDAYSIFKNHFFRAIPIVENNVLVGILTPLDVMKYFCESKENLNHG